MHNTQRNSASSTFLWHYTKAFCNQEFQIVQVLKSVATGKSALRLQPSGFMQEYYLSFHYRNSIYPIYKCSFQHIINKGVVT